MKRFNNYETGWGHVCFDLCVVLVWCKVKDNLYISLNVESQGVCVCSFVFQCSILAGRKEI